jgi:hypothetical protein
VDDLPGMNATVSLSALSKTEKKPLAVNALPLIKQVGKVWLWVDAVADGDYQLKLTELSDALKSKSVFLKDSFTGDSVDLNLQPMYAFFIRKNMSATFGNRFVIYFRQETAVTSTVTSSVSSIVNQPNTLPETVSVKLFPNPAATEIHFLVGKNSIGNIRLNIYDNKGVKIYSSSHQNQLSFKYNVAQLPPGIYVAELVDVATATAFQKLKFIKQ